MTMKTTLSGHGSADNGDDDGDGDGDDNGTDRFLHCLLDTKDNNSNGDDDGDGDGDGNSAIGSSYMSSFNDDDDDDGDGYGDEDNDFSLLGMVQITMAMATAMATAMVMAIVTMIAVVVPVTLRKSLDVTMDGKSLDVATNGKSLEVVMDRIALLIRPISHHSSLYSQVSCQVNVIIIESRVKEKKQHVIEVLFQSCHVHKFMFIVCSIVYRKQRFCIQ